MVKIKEAELINGLMDEDPKTIKYIYKRYYGSICKMTLEFKHIILDPDDVFQEGLTRLIMNVRKNKYKSESSVHTYLYSICRNVCLKESEKKRENNKVSPDVKDDGTDDNNFELFERLSSLMKSIDNKCNEIIRLRFGLHKGIATEHKTTGKSIRFEEIAGLLKITADNARQRFKRCLEKLRAEAIKDKILLECLFD